MTERRTPAKLYQAFQKAFPDRGTIPIKAFFARKPDQLVGFIQAQIGLFRQLAPIVAKPTTTINDLLILNSPDRRIEELESDPDLNRDFQTLLEITFKYQRQREFATANIDPPMAIAILTLAQKATEAQGAA